MIESQGLYDPQALVDKVGDLEALGIPQWQLISEYDGEVC